MAPPRARKLENKMKSVTRNAGALNMALAPRKALTFDDGARFMPVGAIAVLRPAHRVLCGEEGRLAGALLGVVLDPFGQRPQGILSRWGDGQCSGSRMRRKGRRKGQGGAALVLAPARAIDCPS